MRLESLLMSVVKFVFCASLIKVSFSKKIDFSNNVL